MTSIPVGIPRTFEPRPNPFMIGPPIYQGSKGKVPSIPAYASSQKLKEKSSTLHTSKAVITTYYLEMQVIPTFLVANLEEK